MIHHTSLVCVQYKMKILYSKELTAHARCDKIHQYLGNVKLGYRLNSIHLQILFVFQELSSGSS